MAQDDWAVVVGISWYPELENLGAPEHDARAFYDWATSPSGGDLPAGQAQLIVSSNYETSSSAVSARPNVLDVQTAFEKLQEIAERSGRGTGGRVGRRLYIYLSGHGFAPSPGEAALLTANATRYRVGHHIPGRTYGRWFQRARYFDEVVVFMDCSRDSVARVPLNAPPWIDLVDDSQGSALFCAFGTRWSMHARERTFDGVPRGVFTMTLLAGLNGGAYDDEGRITSNSLTHYLFNNTRRFLSQEDQADPDVAQKPDVSTEGPTLIFAQRSPAAIPRWVVRILVPPGAFGKTVEILDGRLQLVQAVPAAASKEVTVELRPGLYLARIAGMDREAVFEVAGLGDVNVAL